MSFPGRNNTTVSRVTICCWRCSESSGYSPSRRFWEAIPSFSWTSTHVPFLSADLALYPFVMKIITVSRTVGWAARILLQITESGDGVYNSRNKVIESWIMLTFESRLHYPATLALILSIVKMSRVNRGKRQASSGFWRVWHSLPRCVC